MKARSLIPLAATALSVGWSGHLTAEPAAPLSSGFVEVDGAQLAFVREGEGPPLLVIGSSVYYPKAFSHEHQNAFRDAKERCQWLNVNRT